MNSLLALRNRQRVRAVNLRQLRRVAVWAIAEFFAARPHQLCIHLVGDTEMARMNQSFLNHAGSTDVITFDHSGLESGFPPEIPQAPSRRRPSGPPPVFHGEIYISIADAVTQGRRFGVRWESELVRYLIHGLLHLDGLDDRTATARRRMKREENRLLKRTARRFAWRDLAGEKT